MDASTLSQFYYYDGSDGSGKIHAGPVWDMDLTLKAADIPWLETRELFYGIKPGVYGTAWLSALYRQEPFYSRVTEIYAETCLPLLEDLRSCGIQAYAATIQQAALLNHLRWGGGKFPQAVQTLQTLLDSRVEFLNRIWVEKEDYVIVTVKEYDGTKTSFAHTPGTPLPALPVYESNETIRYHGWFHYGIGTPFDPSEPVYEDINIEVWSDIIAQAE